MERLHQARIEDGEWKMEKRLFPLRHLPSSPLKSFVRLAPWRLKIAFWFLS
jgi:hypothetical protein